MSRPLRTGARLPTVIARGPIAAREEEEEENVGTRRLAPLPALASPLMPSFASPTPVVTPEPADEPFGLSDVIGRLTPRLKGALTPVGSGIPLEKIDSKTLNPYCLSASFAGPIPGPPLGVGSYGTVVRMCDHSDLSRCNVAEKRSEFDDKFERDAYFLNLLQPIELDGSPIVPRLLAARHCVGGGTPVDLAILDLDLWSGNMDSLGRQQWEVVRLLGRINDATKSKLENMGVRYWYPRDQINRMFDLMEALSFLHIVHGDAKPDNFLYRLTPATTGKRATVEPGSIVVTDFGFSGDKWALNSSQGQWAPLMGWSHPQPGSPSCPSGNMLQNGIFADRAVRDYFNAWQLSEYLRDVTAIEEPDGAITVFHGFPLPIGVRRALEKLCPLYAASTVTQAPGSLPVDDIANLAKLVRENEDAGAHFSVQATKCLKRAATEAECREDCRLYPASTYMPARCAVGDRAAHELKRAEERYAASLRRAKRQFPTVDLTTFPDYESILDDSRWSPKELATMAEIEAELYGPLPLMMQG